MSNKKNTLWLIIQSVATSVSQFFLYRFIFIELGSNAMGLWSIVAATTTIGLISNLGFANGIIKYVAGKDFKNQQQEIHQLTSTAHIANFLFSIPLFIIVFFLSKLYASAVLIQEHYTSFLLLLPWLLTYLFFSNLIAVYNSLLDGLHLFALRSKMQVLAIILFTLLFLWLGKTEGLLGIVKAMVIYTVIHLLSLMIICKIRGFTASILPKVFNKDHFKQLIKFGINIQMAGLLVLLFDPLVKFFITRNYGISTTGLYEIANKAVVQIRTVYVNSFQPITPQAVQANKAGVLNKYLKDKFQKNSSIALQLGILIVLSSPFAGWLFTGSYQPVLLQGMLIISIGWLFNMISTVMYFATLGVGNVKTIIFVHFMYCVTSALLFIVFQKTHVLISFIAPSIALCTGSLLLIYQAAKQWKLKTEKLILFDFFHIFCVVVTVILFALSVAGYSFNVLLISTIIFFIIWLVFLYFTKTYLKLVEILTQK